MIPNYIVSQYASRTAAYQTARLIESFRHNAAGGDHASVGNDDTLQDGDIAADPYISTDTDAELMRLLPFVVKAMEVIVQ